MATGLVVLAALFVAHAWRAAYLCDDAYISFRYVWHFVNGHGLVFNVGERVEGYTNFAWVLELAAVWKVTGVPPEVACHVLSAIATVATLAGVAALARGGPWESRRNAVLLGAFLLLAVSRSFAQWTTSGLETRQFTALVVAGVAVASRIASASDHRRRVRLALAASACFAWAEATRPEGLLLGSCTFAWIAVVARERGWKWSVVGSFAVPFAAFVVAHYLWRHAYYGEWLPNTFHAKFVRPWPEMGLAYVATCWIQNGGWLWIPLALVAAEARRRRGDSTHALTFALLVPHTLYVIQLGGDNFEMRPFDFHGPLLAVAAIEGAFVVGERVVRAPPRSDGIAGARRRASAVVTIVVVAACAVFGGAIQHAKAESSLVFDTRERARRLAGRIDPDRSQVLSWIPGMALLLENYDSLQEFTTPHCVGVLWRVDERLWREELAQYGPYERLRGRGWIPRDAVASRISTGVMGYYLSELTLVDQVGLTDRAVARTPVSKPNSERIFAHDRAATHEYLMSRGVNILVHPAARGREEALAVGQYALRIEDDLWMPFDTRDPEWAERSFDRERLWSWRSSPELACVASGDTSWTLEGRAFSSGPRATRLPVPVARVRARCTGGIVFDSRDEHGRGTGTGVASSPSFVVPEGARFEVRLAARPSSECEVRLVAESGEVVARFEGLDDSALAPVGRDIGALAGKRLRVEIHDGSETNWIAAGDATVLVPTRL